MSDKNNTQTGINLERVLSAAAETAYVWDISADQLFWSANHEQILGQDLAQNLKTGRSYAGYVDPRAATTRYDAVFTLGGRDDGQGVPYQLQYALCPKGRDQEARVWVEDCGRWYAGIDGKPQRAEGIVRVINERYEREKKLTYLSNYDELTGQVNRSHLLSLLDEQMSDAKKTQKLFSYLLISVENLAQINHGYGFDVADQVIAGVAKALRSVLRANDTMGRLSGNKLGILARNADEADMEHIATRLQGAIKQQPILTNAGPVFATIAIGGVVALRHASKVEELLSFAQEALDVAKSDPRVSYISYRTNLDLQQTRRRNAAIAQDVINALNERRMMLSFQPIVDSKNGQTHFYEALLRMQTISGDEISAGYFIPTIEKLGLMRLIDRRVLELSLDALSKVPEINISINVSAHTTNDQDWLTYLGSQLVRDRSIASRLIIEITETSAIEDISTTTRFIKEVKEFGCSVAIDDFGAGHTSFRYLRSLNVDYVKIDGSYIENITQSEDDQFFVRTLVDLCKKLNLKIVAEWVKTPEDAQLLRSWGVDLIQGFAFGEPRRDYFSLEQAEEKRQASAF